MKFKKLTALVCAFAIAAGTAGVPAVKDVFGIDTGITASAEEEIIASGTCGENLTWTLEGYGTLTISGTGDMYDFEIFECPWEEYHLSDVTIKKGVTSIGNYAFAHSNIYHINIPNTVTRIGERAFEKCVGLHEVTIPASVTQIGYSFMWGGDDYDENRIIEGYDGTEAEKFAKKYKFTFVSLGEPPVTPGDLNGSGTPDIKDLILMQKIVAGWKIDESTYDKAAADLNGDNKIDVKDLIKLQKIVAGWKV